MKGVSCQQPSKLWRVSWTDKKYYWFKTELEANNFRLKLEKKYGMPKMGGGWNEKSTSQIWPIEDGMALLEVFPRNLALIDAKYIEKVRTGRRWHEKFGYAYSNELKIFLHQLIIGKAPNGLETDHKDRIKMNNLEGNLHHITPSDNQYNKGMYSSNKTGVKNIYFYKRDKVFVVQTTDNGKAKYYGRFDTLEEAKAHQILINKGGWTI